MHKNNLIAFSVAALTLATSQLEAEEYKLEVIIVTATKRAENQQNIPIAITGMTGDALSRKGINETSDLTGSAPSLMVSSPYGRNQPNFTIRGIGVGNEFNANVASPVGFYVNEDYKQFRASHGAQLFDLDRIEIIRGSQGTLFGRNTTGGAVSVHTVKPELGAVGKYSGFLTAGYGKFDRYRLIGAVETTLIEDKLAVRLAGTKGAGDGAVKNRAPGVGPGEDHDWGSVNDYAARATIVWRPTSDLGVSLVTATSKDNPTGVAPIISETRPGNGVANPLITGFIPGRDFYGLDDDDFEVAPDTNERFEVETDDVTFTVNWGLSSEWSLTTITGYLEGTRLAPSDCDGIPFTICNIDYDQEFNQFNQDIRLSWDDGINARAIFGIYYGEDELNDVTHQQFFLDTTIPEATKDLFRDAFGIEIGNTAAIRPSGSYTQERESRAIYFEGTYDFDEDLRVTLGLRYTEDEFDLIDSVAYIEGDQNFMTALINPECADPERVTPSPNSPDLVLCNTIPLTQREADSDEVTGRLIFDYNLAEEIKVYASYSHGYRAGSFNGLANQTVAQLIFVEPELVDTYEIGFKSRFYDDRMQLNGAFYYNDYEDQQVQEIVGLTTFIRNVTGEMIGAELELEMQASENVYISASMSYIDSEYEDGQFFAGPTSPVDIGGNQFPFAPEVTANIYAEWTVASTGIGEVILSSTARWQDKVWFDPFNDDKAIQNVGPKSVTWQDAYWIADARAELKSENYSLSLWVKNLADEDYNVYAIDTAGSFGYDYFVRGEPRTYGVEVTYHFYH